MSLGQLEHEDVILSASKLPETLVNAIKTIHAWGWTAFIAGGHIRRCIARETLGDIDVFTRPGETEKLIQELRREGHPEPYETDFASTFSGSHRPIQVITKWTFDSVAELFRHFDFTVAKAAIWWAGEDEGWQGACDHRFYRDVAANRLRYDAPSDRDEIESGGTLLRLLKYARAGYTADLPTLSRVAHDAVMSVDTMDQLTEALRGVDPADWPAWVRDYV